MAKYSLTDAQQKLVMAVISAAQIQGKDAPAIMELAKALQTPVTEPKKETAK